MDRTLLHELIDAAARDVAMYKNEENPNRRAAGDAALRSLDAITRAVQEVRTALANELYRFDPPRRHEFGGRDVPGNSGPGF